MNALVWFRNDLRVRDNTALHAACASDAGVIGVFVIERDDWRRHDRAACQIELLLRTLRELSRDLVAIGVPLVVLEASLETPTRRALLGLARAHKCGALHFNREYEVDERARDEGVRRAFEKERRAVHAHTDQTILAPDEVRTGEGRFYTVYSPYRRAWLKALSEREGAAPLPAPRRRDPVQGVASSPIPDTIEGFTSSVPPELWPGGEKHARDRLYRFVRDRLADYASDRDRPDLDGTSALSPYLAIGAISPRTCLVAAIEANGGALESARKGPTTWINELVWREFYTHVLIGFPRVCRNRAFQAKTDLLRWSDDEEQLEAWKQGRTGFPLVDAGMRQLAQTGWMHNRVRMVTAMFLAKDLLIYWRLGEEHFARSLVDFMFANNNGGWQWSASTGTDAAPYFRIFNPFSQSRKFDPEGEYIRRWVPELRGLDGPAIHEPHRHKGDDLFERIDYPAPMVDHAQARVRAIAAFKALGLPAPEDEAGASAPARPAVRRASQLR